MLWAVIIGAVLMVLVLAAGLIMFVITDKKPSKGKQIWDYIEHNQNSTTPVSDIGNRFSISYWQARVAIINWELGNKDWFKETFDIKK